MRHTQRRITQTKVMPHTSVSTIGSTILTEACSVGKDSCGIRGGSCGGITSKEYEAAGGNGGWSDGCFGDQ